MFRSGVIKIINNVLFSIYSVLQCNAGQGWRRIAGAIV
jgi:hypothetical protein